MYRLWLAGLSISRFPGGTCEAYPSSPGRRNITSCRTAIDGCTRQHIHVDDISELAEETQLAIFVCLSTTGTNEQDSSLSGSC